MRFKLAIRVLVVVVAVLPFGAYSVKVLFFALAHPEFTETQLQIRFFPLSLALFIWMFIGVSIADWIEKRWSDG